ncbi:uncharacterized protein STEHIDRAFT_95601 [Stereum hirsutum FP-91666 SS1]|uniref:uncharacterized protein n=1 Tax=Stereum hirsutum (strain FP-91666) TaxID=721885 RepID=UPI000440D35B|nr:uncharacterized protein STEHIDRAFT_95601 [Stereum hirsutum FP-91666 SS1]EIM88426.1 hypothetical protein STEHIDRAFT_95601 [Stereum hirsutum FP-91666 SS1]
MAEVSEEPTLSESLAPTPTAPIIEPVSSPAQSESEPDPTTLTPIRAHYLKKTLIQLQFQRELEGIASTPSPNISTLSYLGPPFTPPPKDGPIIELPFLRYFFRQFVLTFPFLAGAPKDFFPEKVQPFVASLVARNLYPLAPLDDDSETSDQPKQPNILAKLERHFSLFVNYALKLSEPEQVVRLKQSDLDRIELLARKRARRIGKLHDVFEVNVVCVRTVVEKGRMRSRVHEEFIIRTRRARQPDVFVSRRYGDFRTLADELRKVHPEENIRPPPVKDRTFVNAPAASQPLSPSPSRPSDEIPFSPSSDSLPQSPTNALSQSSRLTREKNRLTLRAYLHSLMSSSTIASSPVLQSFLLSGPTMLSHEELVDAQRREEADRVRDDGRKHFAKEVAERVDSLRESVKGVKGDIMGQDGLTRMFGIIKSTEDVRDLPPDFQAVLEWARISLASTVFQHFVAADDASETLAGLKRIHGLMPYFMLKTALKISNPVGMIRTVLDLFLAQPFGGRSLLQRMFTSSLNEEVKALEMDIEAVQEKVEDAIICEKVRQYVYAPREIQEIYKFDAAEGKIHVLAAVLRSGEEPALNRAQMQRVGRSHRAHREYLRYRESLADSDDDDGPPDEDAWLFEDLSILAKLYARLREKEQLIELMFEGVTSDILKDIITIFYAPLAQVYRAASIADSLGDMQNFINDLIRTVESAEDISQVDPQRTVQTFIDLIQRHEQSFYHFVHKVHSKGENLFNDLMRWVELFLTVIREGLGSPISLEFLLPHAGDERKAILAEVDTVALYHYKSKLAYESKIRRRFENSRGGAAQEASAEDEAAQAFVQGFIQDFSMGELMRGDAEDVAAEETDEDSYESSEYESATDDSDEEDDDDDDDDEEEESEEAPRGMTRSRTMVHTTRTPSQPPMPMTAPASSTSTPGSRPSRPPPQSQQSGSSSSRQESLSRKSSRPRLLSLPLRKSRSMTFSANGHSGGSSPSGVVRHSVDVPPPVPPLPKDAMRLARMNSMSMNADKPLPPPPTPPGSSKLSDPNNNHRFPPPKAPSPQSSNNNNGGSRQRRGSVSASVASSKRPASANKGKKQKQRQRQQQDALKPPELKKVPELLPIFLEMMRPQLRVRSK